VKDEAAEEPGCPVMNENANDDVKRKMSGKIIPG
jgi:hypothetical protein